MSYTKYPKVNHVPVPPAAITLDVSEGNYIPISHSVIAQPETGLRTDITGKYFNPTYGITNFEIPGWYASEGMFVSVLT